MVAERAAAAAWTSWRTQWTTPTVVDPRRGGERESGQADAADSDSAEDGWE
ncbi:hypothetical protein [Nocardia arizonensis]|uniref:hypothetical protein n=1 Tax=Nocardia arizonensis TaxID=1141647 RepID=UPI000B2FC776|nr:hypothetical protein [Nocardia arizonensis]